MILKAIFDDFLSLISFLSLKIGVKLRSIMICFIHRKLINIHQKRII